VGAHVSWKMFPLTNYCLILAVSSVLALEILALDKEEISNAERMSYELFRNYGGHKDSPVHKVDPKDFSIWITDIYGRHFLTYFSQFDQDEAILPSDDSIEP